ncbi:MULTISPECIES: DUF1127 domain-containing protein [unclassified Roseivivax]|uniref:DUF1127 domain-containing protein n=1 Tax=Roseivivax sp. GX 12232 TaxID=2900547 RepID=UPI001E3A6967|nr:DUF1127 domain-containing protein [Roseivivax sp. GX 12232]MCE0507045.1 DUF1127 domain-containing protein [Roseivivax sp. GX 12232]
MALIDTHNPLLGPANLAGRIGSLFVVASRAASDWNETRATRKALSALTDRELDDVGLTRFDIERVARRGR